MRDERRTRWIELSIGATTAIYTIVDTVLLRGVRAAGAGELVAVWETVPSWRTQPILADAWHHVVVDYPDFRNWREHQQSFVAVGAFRGDGVTLWSNGRPSTERAVKVSPSLSSVLGTVPTLGRGSWPAA